ncbi:MAG: phosphotransferase [Salinibacterium sp.]|nr:phosphotransferase [Salinibacterium sp.]
MEMGPFDAAAIDAYPSRTVWNAAAADLVGTMLARWNLTADQAFVSSGPASVLRVITADGSSAVLKVGFPHPEGVWEAVALEAWGSACAPTVFRQDAETWALLLEDVEPGIPLVRYHVPARSSLRSAAQLYKTLSTRPVPDGIPTLVETVQPFLDKALSRLRHHLPLLGDNGDVLRAGLEVLAELLERQPVELFLHGDFAPGNIISSTAGWRAIDPKPMRGDPAFDLWPLVSQLGSPWRDAQPERILAEQLQFVAELAGIEVRRAARWGFARAALTLSWFLDEQDARAALVALREAKAWRAVSGA